MLIPPRILLPPTMSLIVFSTLSFFVLKCWGTSSGWKLLPLLLFYHRAMSLFMLCMLTTVLCCRFLLFSGLCWSRLTFSYRNLPWLLMRDSLAFNIFATLFPFLTTNESSIIIIHLFRIVMTHAVLIFFEHVNVAIFTSFHCAQNAN